MASILARSQRSCPGQAERRPRKLGRSVLEHRMCISVRVVRSGCNCSETCWVVDRRNAIPASPCFNEAPIHESGKLEAILHRV